MILTMVGDVAHQTARQRDGHWLRRCLGLLSAAAREAAAPPSRMRLAASATCRRLAAGTPSQGLRTGDMQLHLYLLALTGAIPSEVRVTQSKRQGDIYFHPVTRRSAS